MVRCSARAARVRRTTPVFFGQVFSKTNEFVGYVGTTFNLVKSPKLRLTMHTADLDDWVRLVSIPKGARLDISPYNPA